MRKRGAAARMALCGVLAALAVALMFLGGTVPFASIACPVLASLVLIPVYCECGWKWGLLWYAAVAALAALLAPEKEAAVLFVFFGYYPMLRKLIGRLRVRAAAWVVKLVYVNAAVFAAYGLMLYVFHLTAVMEDFEGMGKAMLAVLLVLANVTFVIYDVLIARLLRQALQQPIRGCGDLTLQLIAIQLFNAAAVNRISQRCCLNAALIS